jgi:hypothetical protein
MITYLSNIRPPGQIQLEARRFTGAYVSDKALMTNRASVLHVKLAKILILYNGERN